MMLIEIALILAVICAVSMVLHAWHETEERKKDREKIIEAKTYLLDQGRWFPVAYCSQRRFSQFWKYSASESSGILLIVNSRVTYFYLESNRILEITFDLTKSKIEWIGRKYFNGESNWVAILYPGIAYYFTAETGITLSGTMEKTHKIYDDLLLASRSTET